MTAPRMEMARLDEARLAKLRALEEEMGLCLVALEPAYRLADLSDEQLAGLRAAEKELGVVLLAYKRD